MSILPAKIPSNYRKTLQKYQVDNFVEELKGKQLEKVHL